jgi:hypothetical protein
VKLKNTKNSKKEKVYSHYNGAKTFEEVQQNINDKFVKLYTEQKTY